MFSLQDFILFSYIFAIICLSFSNSQEDNLLCFECIEASTNEECMREGKITRCQNNERACFTEVRRPRSGVAGMRITKRCKQSLACDNNYWQNMGGVRGNYSKTTGRQCAGPEGRPFASTTCRCCCSTDLCNAGLYTACNGIPTELLRRRRPEPNCTSIDELPINGDKSCSKGNQASSHCHFHCNSKYSMFGRLDISCQKINKYTARWTGRPPCCARQCPPYGNADIVFAVQSNVPSISEWQRLKMFLISTVRSFVRAEDGNTRIGLFTFNDKPDRIREIYLSDGYQLPNKLYRDIFNLRRTTYPGLRLETAMTHAQRVSLTPTRGDRADVRDVIVIVTYGESHEDQTGVSIPARQLRDDGVKIKVVNVQPRGGSITPTYMQHLTEIAGSRAETFLVRSGSRVRLSQLMFPLQRAICGHPCNRYGPIRSEHHARIPG